MTSPHDHTLAALQQEFPAYRLWLEPGRGDYRFVARRLHAGTGLYAVVTSDPAELRTALTTTAQRDSPGPRNQDSHRALQARMPTLRS